jgi:hypothetical protein
MWVYYSVKINDNPMILRSSADISLLTLSSIYIIRNKSIASRIQTTNQPQILPK